MSQKQSNVKLVEQKVYQVYCEEFAKLRKQLNKTKFCCFIFVQGRYEAYVSSKSMSQVDSQSISNICGLKFFECRTNSNEIISKCSFAACLVEKYIEPLIEEDYRVICVNVENESVQHTEYTKKDFTEEKEKIDEYVMVCYWEPQPKSKLMSLGIAIVDQQSGKSFYFECTDTIMEMNWCCNELTRITNMFEPEEIIHTMLKKNSNELILQNIPKHECNTKLNDNMDVMFTKTIYQEQMFSKCYSNMNDIDLLNTNETPFATIAFTYLLQHLYTLNPNVLSKLNEPIAIQSQQFLKLENDSCLQLNIISRDENELSLLKLLNNCKTKYGKQLFKVRLLQPTFDVSILQQRYNNIETVMKDKEKMQKTRQSLDQLSNIEQILQRMKFQRFRLKDILQLYKSLEKMEQIFMELNMEQSAMINLQMIAHISEQLNIAKLETKENQNLSEIQSNVFVRGLYQELDEMISLKNRNEQYLQRMVDQMNQIIGMGNVCKLEFNKPNEEYYISIVSSRLPIFQQNYERKKRVWNHHITFDFSKFTSSKSRRTETNEHFACFEEINDKENDKENNNNCEFDFDSIIVVDNDDQKRRNQIRLTHSVLIQKSEEIRNINKNLQENVCSKLSEFCYDFVKNYSKQIELLLSQIAEIDVDLTNAHNAFHFGYCKPVISSIENNKSFVNAISLRHAIIEQIQKDVPYITNNICLGSKETNGIVLFGSNEVGKSSLMKSLAIAVILAQAGMFVPCSNFEFYPFEQIFTRISNNDNLYRGQSSFKVEMLDVKSFVQRSSSKTLIIADEVAATTETTSAICLVSAILQTLISNNAQFCFTTHLHEISKIEAIQKALLTKKLQFYHLSVTMDDNGNFVYNRKLQPGQGDDFYGLNICRQMKLPKQFLEIAEETRKEIDGNSKMLVNMKTSRYNSNHLVDACEVCNDRNSPLETHHINPQRNADQNGFITDANGTRFHKNNKYNLATLCHSCHKKEQSGEIVIYGWVMTSIGKQLAFDKMFK